MLGFLSLNCVVNVLITLQVTPLTEEKETRDDEDTITGAIHDDCRYT